jgi:Ca2+-dependent lipid-binding protein
VINNTTEPKWDYVAEVTGFAATDSFKFTVYDKDTFSSKDLLGKAELAKSQFLPSGFTGELKMTHTDGGGAVAADSHLNVKVEIIKSYAEESKQSCTSKKLSEGGSGKTGPANPQEAPKLIVSIVSATGLRNADWGGCSDPYCICEVPGKNISRIMTPVIQDKLDPVWNYTKEVIGWEVGDSLSLAVFDKDPGMSDDVLGRVTVPADKLYPFQFEGELPLKDSGKGIKATIHVKSHLEYPDKAAAPEAAKAG